MSDPSTASTGERPGDVIGRYKLLERIGEGGMGSVWMAEQREPVKRRVALKVIKLGMDTKQVIARFEAERQALALMDHPNIAKVLDAGSTETGRPYFVMEYIKGIPIVEYCDQERLDTRSRLELFTSVCQAIQHAHHKGVIHRDIKPGNVLVTLHDGVPVPKVIDFGIAKATSAELTAKTLFTEHRQMLGTPAYMSPEQAEMSGLDIDTRTDVYSLGVLLYELLTGTTPFDIKTLLESGFGEMMRAIREDEPHKPSTRISSLGDTGARTAQQRRVDVRKLSVLLRGDLDWIVMKCLEKDRTRRYETASGLAADVRRHLFDEPVTAGPPGTGYRLRKFARRHRAQVVAACVVLSVLVLGVTGTTAGMIWANDEADRAEAAKTRATLAAANETAAKAQAQENEAKAVEAARRAEAAKEEEARARRRAETIGGFVIKALRSSDPEHAGGGQATTVLAAMDSAVADIESGRFADDPAVEAGLKDTIGLILRNNGRVRDAEVLLASALETQRRLSGGDSQDLTRVMNNLALVLHETGRNEEAKRLFAEALEMNRRLHPGDHEAVALALCNLASTVSPEEAELLVRQAMAMRRRLFRGESEATARDLNQLAFTFERSGRIAEAEPLYAEALEVARRVCKGDDPLVAIVLDNLGKARTALGRGAEGTELLAQALAMRRRLFKAPHPDLATGVGNLAAALRDQKRWAEAEPLAAEALEMQRQLFPGDSSRIVELLFKLSMVRRQLGRAADAERLAAEALEMAQRLHPGDHLDVARSLAELGSAQFAGRRFPEAEATSRRALEMFRRLHEGDHAFLARALQDLAMVLCESGRAAEADPLQVEAVAMVRRLFPGDHASVSMALYTLGRIRQAAGRVAEAVPEYEAALAMDRKLLPRDHTDLVADVTTLALAYYLIGNFEKAIPLYEEALKANEATLGRQHPATLLTIGNLGASYRRAGRVAEATPLLEEAWRSVKLHPATLSFVGPHLLDAYVAVADPAKERTTARATALCEELIAESRATLARESPELAMKLTQLSLRLLDLKAWNEAEPLLREALAIREKTQPDAWTTFNTRSQLGGALLGQERYAEAEPLLLDGYRGMKAREATIEVNGRIRLPQALERLVRLYEATGDTNAAANWKRELEAATSGPPSTPGR